MGDVLDSNSNPYYKKSEIDNILYKPYTFDVARVLSWGNSVVKFNIYAAFRHVDPELNCDLLSATE